ncbi:MAG: DUF4418 family protein [Oscillospiraceae bacterium]|nr:DUF4418 family protein [Oscillospiraceae bacterium]
MKNKVTNAVVYLILGILLIIGPYTLFPVCDTAEKIMKCFWATRAVNTVGGIIAFFGIALLLLKNQDSVITVNLCSVVAGTAAILLPSVLIGGCAKDTMPCQALTFPAIYLISAVVILFSVGNLIYLKKAKRGT